MTVALVESMLRIKTGYTLQKRKFSNKVYRFFFLSLYALLSCSLLYNMLIDQPVAVKSRDRFVYTARTARAKVAVLPPLAV